MPYKRFRKTLFKKVRGTWTKKKTYKSAKQASTAMKRMQAEEKLSKKKSR